MSCNEDNARQSYISNFKLDLEIFQRLRRNNGEDCDVLLRSPGNGSACREIPCHRVVLKAASRYFIEKLAGDGRREMIIQIDTIEPQILEILIDYIYSGRRSIELSPENVFDIFHGAGELSLEKLQKYCCGYIRNMKTIEHVTKVLEFALVHLPKEGLDDICVDFILENLGPVRTAGLYDLSFESFQRIVEKGAESGLIPTKDILQAVSEWLHKNEQQRKAHAFTLIKGIPLGNLDMGFLEKTFREDELMRTIPEVYDLCVGTLFQYAKQQKLLDSNKGKSPEAVLSNGIESGEDQAINRNSGFDDLDENTAKQASIATGKKRKMRVAVLERSSGGEETPKPIAGPSKRLRAPPTVSKLSADDGNSDRKIVYYIARKTKHDPKTVMSLDLESDSRSAIITLEALRSTDRLECHNSKIYIMEDQPIGIKKRKLATFDLTTRKLDSMDVKLSFQKFRAHCQSVVVKDHIYVIGGESINRHTLNSVERLLLNENLENTVEWREVAPMLNSRKSFQVAVVDGRIFALGGYVVIKPDPKRRKPECSYSTRALKVVDKARIAKLNQSEQSLHNAEMTEMEMYDPELDTWQSRSPMPGSSDKFAVAVAGHSIYVLGGLDDGSGTNCKLDTVYVYDSLQDRWHRGGDSMRMSKKRSSFSAVVFDNFIYALGGDGDSPGTGTIERLDMERETWEVVGVLPDGVYKSTTVCGHCAQE